MAQQQVNHFPWDEIPDIDVLEAGDYLVRGNGLEDGLAGTGKRMFSAQIEVQEPDEAKGMFLFENFVTGSEEAPTSILPGTMGTRRLKRMLTAAQIPATNNTDQICSGFEGALFGVRVSKYTEEKGEYAGTERNKINKFMRVGEFQPQIGIVTGGPAAAAQRVVAPQKPPAAGQPKQAPPPPPQAPAPPSTNATVPPPPPAGAQTDNSGETLVCAICHQNIPAAEFAAHVQECAQNMEER